MNMEQKRADVKPAEDPKTQVLVSNNLQGQERSRIFSEVTLSFPAKGSLILRVTE